MPKTILPQLQDASVFSIPAGLKIPSYDWQHNPKQPADTDNYGVHCGKSGFVVLDLDVGHSNGADGIETFKALCPDGQMPDTFTVSTPSGGLHLYFKGDMKRHPNTWPGVDVLGGSGYVVGPGSYTDKGSYEVVSDRPVSELPGWLKNKIEARLNRYQVKPGWSSVRQVERNQGNAYDYVTELLSARGSARNNQNWQCPAHNDGNPSMTVTEAEDRVLLRCHAGCDTEQIVAALGIELSDLYHKQPVPEPEIVKNPGLFTFKTGAELDDTPFTYRVDGLLPTGCNVLFAAYQKTGKTSTMLNLARALTTKEHFLGQFHTDRVTGKVVYVNFELDEQMFRKYMTDNGLDLENPRLVILNLRGRVGHFKILDEQFRNIFAEMLKEQDCEVLIIDPLSVVMSVNGMDSDNNDQARMMLEMFTEVEELAGIDHVIVVDHTGHDAKGRARNASAKGDWADVLWVQEKNGSDLTRKFKAEGRGVDEQMHIITRNDRGTIETKLPEDVDGGDWAVIENELKKGLGPSQTELAKATGIAPETLRRRLEKHEGEIERRDMRGTKAKALYLKPSGE